MSELYLKDEKVLTLKDIDGVPREIQRVDAPELLPVCLESHCTNEAFQKWMESRGIPKDRETLDELIKEHGTSWLVSKNYASLSDQYWIKWRSEKWKQINFFTNVYPKMIGDMFFTPWEIGKQRKYETNSPDLTTKGRLVKRWGQNSDKTSFLVKAGSTQTHQEPLSEVLVSVLAEQLNIIPNVKYDMWVEGVTICSKSDNFITQDTDYVPAIEVFESVPYEEKSESMYTHLLKMCDKFDIPNVKEFIDGMIFIDNLTGNEDRRLDKFGFIRDVNTMKFLGAAPLFASGSAYWSTKKITDSIKSKYFGDVENKIVDEMKSKVDLTPLTRYDAFEHLISRYPGITDKKKENLIDAIRKRNMLLTMDKSLSISESIR